MPPPIFLGRTKGVTGKEGTTALKVAAVIAVPALRGVHRALRDADTVRIVELRRALRACWPFWPRFAAAEAAARQR